MNDSAALRIRDQRLEAINAFAGRFGHDLNNALSPLLMSLSLLKSDETDPQKQALLAMMEGGIHRASDMIRQTLAYARGLEGLRIPIDPADLLREQEPQLREGLAETIDFSLIISPPLPSIRGDRPQLRDLLLELCRNAQEAMEEGGSLRITAEGVRLSSALPSALGAPVLPGDYLRITVDDTGTGIAPENAFRIFEPYFSTKPKSKGKGKGLGLPNVLAVLLGHQGLIRFTSVPGEGSTFEVYLPACAAPGIHQGPTG